MTVTFVVNGVPAAQGSKRAFVRGGRAVVVETSKNTRPWRALVTDAAIQAMTGPEHNSRVLSIRRPMLGPVALELQLHYPRPLSHYRTGRFSSEIKRNAPTYLTRSPDADKCARAICDALTGICYRDDAQVAVLYVVQLYSDDGRAFAHVTVRSLGTGHEDTT